jgi:hypothetical protein
MTTIAFNTLDFANKLKAAGQDSKIAEATAQATAQYFEETLIATLSTKMELFTVESNLQEKIAKIKFDMVTWMFGMFLAQTALLVTLIKFLH